MTNQQLFLSIFSLAHKNALIDFLLIIGANYLIFFTFFLIIILTVKYLSYERRIIFLIPLSLAISAIIIFMIRQFIFVPRPFVALSITPLISDVGVPSFPSIHTTIMAVVAFSYLFYRSRFTIIFLIILGLVGISRIAVGVHYPLDILAGLAVGFLSVAVAFFTEKFLIKKLLGFFRQSSKS